MQPDSAEYKLNERMIMMETNVPYAFLLDRFVEASRKTLQDNLLGIYLHGSAVMGCFNPLKSDLDLIIVIRETMTDEIKRTYMDLILALDSEVPAKGIEMSVVTRDVCDPFIYPTPFDLHYSRMHSEWYRQDPEDYIQKMKGTDQDLAAHFTGTVPVRPAGWRDLRRGAGTGLSGFDLE